MLLNFVCTINAHLHEQEYPPRVLMHSCSHPWSGPWHSSYSWQRGFLKTVIKLIWANLHEACGEACFLHRAIGDEFNPEAVGSWLDVLGHLVSAECPDQRCRWALSVSNLQEVVNAIIVILDLKRLELESDLKILRHSEALSWNISSQSLAIWFNPIVTKVSKHISADIWILISPDSSWLARYTPCWADSPRGSLETPVVLTPCPNHLRKQPDEWYRNVTCYLNFHKKCLTSYWAVKPRWSGLWMLVLYVMSILLPETLFSGWSNMRRLLKKFWDLSQLHFQFSSDSIAEERYSILSWIHNNLFIGGVFPTCGYDGGRGPRATDLC